MTAIIVGGIMTTAVTNTEGVGMTTAVTSTEDVGMTTAVTGTEGMARRR
jgi:hypothetical protein